MKAKEGRRRRWGRWTSTDWNQREVNGPLSFSLFRLGMRTGGGMGREGLR